MKKALGIFLVLAMIFSAFLGVNAETNAYIPNNRVLVEGEAKGNITLMLVKKSVTDISQLQPSDIGYVSQCESDGEYKFDFNFYKDIQDYSVLVSNETGVISDSVNTAQSSIEAIDFNRELINNESFAKLSVEIENKFDLNNIEYTMVLAVYDENGALISVKTKANTADTISDEIVVPENGTARAFIWGDTQTMIPLCGVLSEEKVHKTFYVSLAGDDSNDGSENAPLASIEKAVEKAKAYKTEHTPNGGKICIALRGGTYRLSQQCLLTDLDFSGTTLEIKAYDGETVKLTRAKELDNSKFIKVTDPDILSRIPEETKDNLYMIDLAAEGITEFGDIETKSSGKTYRQFDIYYNSEPLTLGRYPNEGYMYISEVNESDKVDGIWSFYTDDERYKNWLDAEDMRAYAFFRDWDDVYMKASAGDGGKITLSASTSYDPYVGARFFVYNMLEEIDMPGEYYLDRTNAKLYLYPPADISSAKIEYVNNTDTFTSYDADENGILRVLRSNSITFKNIEFYGAAGNAVYVAGKGVAAPAEYINFENCRIYNVAWNAIYFGYRSTENITVSGCELTNLGAGGIYFYAGNEDTLEAANIEITNNYIHNYSLYNLAHHPGINMHGYGIKAANNLICDAPHMAVNFGGYNNVIEDNYVYNVMQDVNDSGAFYTGNNWVGGNLIQRNIIRSCRSYNDNIMGIYIDYFGSNATVKNNIFIDLPRGVSHSGGIYNTLENNLFINCDIPYGYRMISESQSAVFDAEKAKIEKYKKNEVYVKEFPYIVDLLEKEPEKTLGSKISNNIASNCGDVVIADLVAERNDISEPIVDDDITYDILSDGEIEIFNFDNSIFNLEIIKNIGPDGTGNYTLPLFYRNGK